MFPAISFQNGHQRHTLVLLYMSHIGHEQKEIITAAHISEIITVVSMHILCTGVFICRNIFWIYDKFATREER